MNLDELEAEAMKLDLSSRAELSRRLAASLESATLATTPEAPAEPVEALPASTSPEAPKVPTDDERERLWLQDAMRRSRELRAAQPADAPPFGFASRTPAPAGGRDEKRPAPSRKKPPGRRSAPRASARRPSKRPTPKRARAKRPRRPPRKPSRKRPRTRR